MHRFIERARRNEIASERLLEDDAGVLREAGGAECQDELGARCRRNRQVEEPAGAVPEFGVGVGDRVLELIWRGDAQAGLERPPRDWGWRLSGRLDARIRELTKVPIGQVAAGGRDDSVTLWQQAGLGEAEQTRQELPARRVSCAAE